VWRDLLIPTVRKTWGDLERCDARKVADRSGRDGTGQQYEFQCSEGGGAAGFDRFLEALEGNIRGSPLPDTRFLPGLEFRNSHPPVFPTSIDETCKCFGIECCRVEGIEVGTRLVRISPCNSRTRSPLSTPNCRHGQSIAPEHAF
jgi:hypothetical protein